LYGEREDVVGMSGSPLPRVPCRRRLFYTPLADGLRYKNMPSLIAAVRTTTTPVASEKQVA